MLYLIGVKKQTKREIHKQLYYKLIKWLVFTVNNRVFCLSFCCCWWH